MNTDNRIPVVVLAGFLGSGKTTLLNNLLSQANGQKIVALVNDFGALNVDAELVVGVEGNTVSFANGCVCCTIHDDLAQECANVLAMDVRPDLVLVELSGVSEPVPVMNTFLETELRPFFDLCAVLTVVDAAGWKTLGAEPKKLAKVQIRDADVVVLSKTDLVSDDMVREITDDLSDLNATVQVLKVAKGKLPLGLLLDQTFSHEVRPQIERTPHGMTSVHWSEASQPLSLPALQDLVKSLPEGVVRMKGFIWIEELPKQKFLLQAVGSRHEIYCLGEWERDCPATRLVVIGMTQAMNDSGFERQLQNCVGSGNAETSPILRLLKRIAPDHLERPAA